MKVGAMLSIRFFNTVVRLNYLSVMLSFFFSIFSVVQYSLMKKKETIYISVTIMCELRLFYKFTINYFVNEI